MIELHEQSIIFTSAIFIAGILYGQYMYRQGYQSGTDTVVKDLLSQNIIDLDDDGMIIRAE